MHKIVPAILGCALTIATFSPALAENPIETQKDKVSYAIGLQFGQRLSTLKDDINITQIIMGLKDGQSGAEPQLTDAEMTKVMTVFQEEMQAKQQTQAIMAAAINAEAATAFLAENKTKEGVITLDSGLQYKVISKGTGPSPQATDTVSVHYRGTLLDGTEFDSSYKRNEPAAFPVNRVIAGWTEALQLMKVGSKWQLFIPADLAYGERGSGRMIGPNAMLIFDVELLEIKAN